MSIEVTFTGVTPTAMIVGMVCAIAGDLWSAALWSIVVALDLRIKRRKQ